MPQPELVALAEELEAAGLSEDAERLREADSELLAIERPPGFFGRVTQNLKATAARQWQHVLGELQESQEVWGLIRAQASGERELSLEERDAVRSQLLDMVRVVPAGVVALANSAFPVPATSMLTPWLLAKMGLLPSRWREARALDLLQSEHAHLRAIGDVAHAAQLEDIIARVEAEAEAREEVRRRSELLTYWDANGNGVWDEDEELAYAEAVEALAAWAKTQGHARRWYLQLEDQVFGPVRLSELSPQCQDGGLLVCFDGNSGWVALVDLVRAGPLPSAAQT